MDPKQKFMQRGRRLPILLAVAVMAVLAAWLGNLPVEARWQVSGSVNFSLGFLMLAGFTGGVIFRYVRLPLITGYIVTGIIIGPHVTGLFSEKTIQELKLLDDLALSFIALTAGGSLEFHALARRGKAIGLNILLVVLCVFSGVFFLVTRTSGLFSFTAALAPEQLLALGLLLGVLATGVSPSSVIAIIRETRAKGPFTDTALGVSVSASLLMVVLFAPALSGARTLLASGPGNPWIFALLGLEFSASLFLGGLVGAGLAYYMRHVGHDLPLVLLLAAFGVARSSQWMSAWISAYFDASLRLDPMLICMAAGFTAVNFSKSGALFIETLDRFSMPVFLLFFSLTGASLNLQALFASWPLALALALTRAGGIFAATRLAGSLCRDAPLHRNNSFMAYISQAVFAIGLADLAGSQFPELKDCLVTVVLAIITINQIAGPVLLKTALNQVGEARIPRR